jgi:GNAT superfamily N-acetyltransferase
VFSPAAENSERTTDRKRLLVLDHPGAGKNPAIVVSLPDKGVIGTAFLIDRVFPRDPAMIHGTFISSICIDEGVRGLGYSRILMAAAIDACKARGSAIALVIARRAADHFYTQFGFWGLSQYSKLTVDAAALSATPTSELCLRPAIADDLPICAVLYDTAYQESFGRCLRDSQTWRYVLEKATCLHVCLSVVENSGSVVGYAIHDDAGNVHELAIAGSATARGTLALLAGRNVGSSLLLHVSPDHPVISALSGLDITLSTRECPFGGHMVRVLDAASLATAAERRIEQHAHLFGLAPQTETVAGIHAVWDGTSARLRVDGLVDGLAATARLCGAARVSSFDGNSQLDPPVSFNIPLVDQS